MPRKWTVTEVQGLGNLPKLVLVSEDAQFSCEIYTFGATLTSWKHRGVERIFVSDSAVFNGVTAIRGGIPLVFPQFGQPSTSLPQHGFARKKMWKISSLPSSAEKIAASIAVTFALHSTVWSQDEWPYEFSLFYTVTLSSEGLTCSLRIKNIDSKPFECHSLLHTYLKVGNIETVRVLGLWNNAYLDKVRGGDRFEDDREVIIIESETDRIYTGGAREGARELQLMSATGALQFTATASLIDTATGNCSITMCPDVVVWNPWVEKARSLPDLGEEAYPKFVCLEPGTVADWVTVPAGGTLTLSQTLTPLDS